MKMNVLIVLFCTIIMTTNSHANWLSVSSNKSFGLLGHIPYQASIGAKLYQPTVFDAKGVAIPTVGAIVYIPTIFCEKSINQAYFRFADEDGDSCLTANHDLKWYKLNPISGEFDSVRSWDELEAIEINNDTHPGHILPSGFIPESQFTTGLVIPKDAAGYRIGFIYQPISNFGVPNEGTPIRVWDLGYFFGQDAPSKPGLVETHFTSHKIKPIDNLLANAGGVVFDPPSKPMIEDVTFNGYFLEGTQIALEYNFIPPNNGLEQKNYDDWSRIWWGKKGETLAIAKEEYLNGPVDAYSPVLTQENIGAISEVTILPIGKNIEDGYAVTGDFQTYEIEVPQKIGEFTFEAVDPNLTAIANGLESLPYIVTLKDTRSNPMINQRIEFVSNYPEGLSEQYIDTDSNGEGRILVSSKYTEIEVFAISPMNDQILKKVSFIGASLLDIQLPEDTAKINGSIDMTIVVRDKFRQSMPYMPVSINTIKSVNRQNVESFVKYLRFNGRPGSSAAHFTTDENGVLKITITEAYTLGRESTFQVSSHNALKTDSVKFTVLTSPDSQYAKNWGHMADRVTVDNLVFLRPKLSKEFPVETSDSIGFEIWGKYTFREAQLLCGDKLPTLSQLQTLYHAYPDSQLNTQLGWPIIKYGTGNSNFYWSQDKTANEVGFQALEFETGEIQGHLENEKLYVTCMQ
ncbi:adhesion domain-containing protein [Thorsellia anophelis]|uniref:Big-1 domain-containing protein n=1 Tax=Thorsellia anophelis DSM 18579 TaxID=1123402 RepID=A0A1I0AU25_9GAMM|nr:DUF823 domain-containing adhesin [Thorsellia anophelis]SES97063.1 repeat of unknown function [Thorsellia anophelis DSM 18579]